MAMAFWRLSSSPDKPIRSIFIGGSIYYMVLSFLFLYLMLRKYMKRWNGGRTFSSSKLVYLFSFSYIFIAPYFFGNACSVSPIPFFVLVSFSRQWKQDLTQPDPTQSKNTYSGWVGVGWGRYFNICLTRMGTHTLPHLGFGTRMENNYIFWDENGKEVPCPKPAPLPFLLMKIYHP